MAIRDRVRRALHKSEASDAISYSDSNFVSDNTSHSSDDVQLEKTASRLARAILFGSSDREKSKEQHAADKGDCRRKVYNSTTSAAAAAANTSSSSSKQSRRRTHPRDKPLTAQNIRHQEMLSQFSMTFGASDPSQIETLSFVGISPCCTRPGSPRASIADLDPVSRASFSATLSNSSSSTSDSSREE